MIKTNTNQEQNLSNPAQPQTLPVEEVLQAVHRDCRMAPEEYLDETAVPHGGE